MSQTKQYMNPQQAGAKSWIEEVPADQLIYKQRSLGKDYIVEYFSRKNAGGMFLVWARLDADDIAMDLYKVKSNDGLFGCLDEMHCMYKGNSDEMWNGRLKTVAGMFDLMREH